MIDKAQSFEDKVARLRSSAASLKRTLEAVNFLPGEEWNKHLTELVSVQRSLESLKKSMDENFKQFYVVPFTTQNSFEISEQIKQILSSAEPDGLPSEEEPQNAEGGGEKGGVDIEANNWLLHRQKQCKEIGDIFLKLGNDLRRDRGKYIERNKSGEIENEELHEVQRSELMDALHGPKS